MLQTIANNLNNSLTFTQRAKIALAQSAISTTSNTAVQSAVNGDSFSNAMKDQIINIVIGAATNLGAQEIGNLAHSPKLDASGNIMRDASNNIIYQITT